MTSAELDLLCINTIRTLSIDAVQKAKSGHPGTPMGAAPTAYTLWQRILRYDPDDPEWPNRDRFVLSNGHASAMLYSLLFLAGVRGTNASYKENAPAVSMDDLRNFRQKGSHCPGHPEYGLTSGVESTTGPLGQGVANSVGMAIAGKWLAANYNRPGHTLFDYNVYAMCGDGCLMEGISSEAASLAAHLKLSNLCWIYDYNHISIEGSTHLAFTEDVAGRFESYGWGVTQVHDANDVDEIESAYRSFLETDDRPTLIIVPSHIGYGSPHKQDTAEAHGEPLGPEEVRLAKQFYGWDPDAQFLVPDEVPKHFQQLLGERGRQARHAWSESLAGYRKAHPDLAVQLDQMQRRDVPEWESALPAFPADAKGLATRDSSGKVLNALAQRVPWLLGGSADLAPSTKTTLKFDQAGVFQPVDDRRYAGRNFHFGVREHAMAAIANGMSLSKLRPFAATFFIFTDYCRPAIRLSALMEIPVIFVLTHDSVSLGEDGPTHQPIEHLASLRAMPGMMLIRPADANEVAEAWRVIMQTRDHPICLVLTRQAVPTFDRQKVASASGLSRGAYVLLDAPDGKPDVLLIASGSEVSLCVAAQEKLATEGIRARVVSMPSWELFERQSEDYRDSVLPPQVTARVSVEEGSPFGWERYVGRHGAMLGIRSFGLSAPVDVVQRHFGFTPEHVVAAAKEQVERREA